MAEIKKLLDYAIETEINNLNSASNKDEKSEVIKNLAALHKLRIEEIKTETEIEEKSERRAMDKAAHDEDATLKAFQLDENTLDRYAKIGIAAAELVLPLMFYGVWMRRGLRFEETGTFTSQTFKNLFNRFKPIPIITRTRTGTCSAVKRWPLPLSGTAIPIRMSSGYFPFPMTRVIGRLVRLLLLLRKNAKVPKIKTTGITVLRAMRAPSERIGLWNATATPV